MTASEVTEATLDSNTGMSSDNVNGLILGLSSSFFIGASFIVKKKGLKKAGASGVRAGAGGYSNLYEPLWWIGMITMVVGEIANFAAYAFAPAILVTPLGALSIIISAVLAHIILMERSHIFGILGCVFCVMGSTTIVLHAPVEREIESVTEVWDLATEPALVMAIVFILVFHYIPQYGQTYWFLVGHECQSTGNCIEVDNVWNKSANIYPDTGLRYLCHCLCDHSNELFKQGEIISFYVTWRM